MSLVPGQPVKASVTNAAYLSRKTDSDTVAVIGLKNTANPNSGPIIINTQRVQNELMDTVGMSEGDANRKNYSVNNIVVDGETHKQSIERLDAEFNPTTGHTHSGSGNEGAKIDVFDLKNLNFLHAEWQSFNASANGLNININTQMGSKLATGSSTVKGVITTQPYNRVIILDQTKHDFLEDTEGQMIYGRITYSAPNWTLTFYTNENGVETAYNFGSTKSISCYFLEVFDVQERPTIPSNPMVFGSLDVTSDVVDASILVRGLINTLTQAFAGNKEFTGVTTISNLTNAVSAATGALIVLGGLGVAKDVFLGQLLDVIGNCFFGKTEIRDTTQSTDKDTGALVVQGGVGIEKNLNVGGNAVIQGDLTVQGTTTTLNTATLDVEDQNITVNKNGNDVSAEGAGLTVERAGTHGSFVYADALASKWKAGALGSETEVLTEGTNQTISGQKTFNAKATFNSQLVFDEEVNGVSSGADVTLPTPTKFYHVVTNAALTSIAGVTALSKQAFVLINKTGATIVLKKDAAGTPANGFLNGAGTDIPMRDGSSLFFVYSPTASRWVILGAFVSSETKSEAIGPGGTLSRPTALHTNYLMSTTGGAQTADGVLFGATDPASDEAQVTIVGNHATDIPTLTDSRGSVNGIVINGDMELKQYTLIKLQYFKPIQRWVEVTRSQNGVV